MSVCYCVNVRNLQALYSSLSHFSLSLSLSLSLQKEPREPIFLYEPGAPGFNEYSPRGRGSGSGGGFSGRGRGRGGSGGQVCSINKLFCNFFLMILQHLVNGVCTLTSHNITYVCVFVCD